ncbi:MAG: ABC transporter ATP-binding protein [Terracidiphilus sp.]
MHRSQQVVIGYRGVYGAGNSFEGGPLNRVSLTQQLTQRGRVSRRARNMLKQQDASPRCDARSLAVAEHETIMTIPAIETTALTRRFGDFTAVQDVNLFVDAGQFFGFLGPNGAGKSTTIKMLTGLLAPTSGSIRILGEDFAANSAEIKRQIGVVPEGMALFGRLTAEEYLRFVGRMYGLDRATTLQRTHELLEYMQLAGEDKKLIADFSHGMQKKLALAAAVIHGPKILFLDEPFEGVDAVAAGTLKSMLQRMIARGATVFLTSHVLEIVERLCTHVAIIHRGHLVAQGSLDELRAGAGRLGQTAPGIAPVDGTRRNLEEIFLEIVGTDREGNPAATAPEQELSWLS